LALSATIKNPLTIIAIFAGIVEVGSTTVLPFLQPSVQEVYVWFLMLFPTALVLTFFLTLNFNHKVLYAPSDYQNDESFVSLASSQLNDVVVSNSSFGDSKVSI
jgi:hypothetical protein